MLCQVARLCRVEPDAAVVDVVGDDFVGADAAAVLADVHRPAEAGPFADLAEVDDRVGVGQQVAFVQRALDQAVERGLVRRVEQQAADRAGIVDVPRPRRRRFRDSARGTSRGRPIRRPCGGSGGRCTRIARSAPSRWRDRPARCRRSPPGGRRGRNCRRRRRSCAEPPGQFGLPAVPGLEVQVAAGHAAAVAAEDVHVLARPRVAAEKVGRSTWPSGSSRAQFPAEHPPGILGVALGSPRAVMSKTTPERPSCVWPARANWRPNCVLPIPVEPTTTVKAPGRARRPAVRRGRRCRWRGVLEWAWSWMGLRSSVFGLRSSVFGGEASWRWICIVAPEPPEGPRGMEWEGGGDCEGGEGREWRKGAVRGMSKASPPELA